MFNKLEFISPSTYNVTKRKELVADINLNKYLEQVFEFAFSMTYGHEGHHRNHRSGGSFHRKNSELFINAFQGKLAEYGVYKKLTDFGLAMNEPDLRIMAKGVWDDSDFLCAGKKISVKSTAHFSNLLLLEQKDLNADGAYIPNLNADSAIYDYFILCRIKPDGKQLMRDHKEVFFKDEVNKIDLKRLMLNGKTWLMDIPGFITHQDLLFIISEKFILPRGGLLNGKIAMDASNYYVQSGDLHLFEELVELLKC